LEQRKNSNGDDDAVLNSWIRANEPWMLLCFLAWIARRCIAGGRLPLRAVLRVWPPCLIRIARRS